ncbi:MAG: DUF484 family protein [Kangiellaceae bacterium]|nr:DUF484 family protein [Kangiellaceae bacterium]MCW8998637.1 DUF484 family protein [Kangiellaceae bacterium]
MSEQDIQQKKLFDSLLSDNHSDLSSESINQQNQRLKTTLQQLLHSAQHNQETQEKFYQLELYFLQADSFQCLMNRVLQELKSKFRLTQVELYLFDPEREVRQLLEEIYGRLDYENLHYFDNLQHLKALYSSSIKTRLSQDSGFIKPLFKGFPQQSKSVALLPLTRGNTVIGSLHIGSRDANRFSPQLATHFLQHLASIISVCIESSLNQERYKHLSLVDILTRAKNRRYFFQALAKEISRSVRSEQPLSCLFLDIDHFKKINDSYGHLIGDRALKFIVQKITPLLRRSDVLARFGGEEFTVLLPNTNQQDAYEIADRIREIIETNPLQTDEHEIPITLSIGYSAWQPKSDVRMTPEEIQNLIINQADEAVYAAKSSGRNCVKPNI